MKAEQNERLTRTGPGTPGGELLRLVEDKEAVRDRAAADVADRLHLKQAHALEVGPAVARCPLTSPAAPLAFVGPKKKIQIINNRLHPRAHFLFEVTR